MTRVLAVARVLLVIVMITHAFGKIQGFDAFADKFNLPPVVIGLLTFAELAGAAGVAIGGFIPGTLGVLATWLGAFAIAITQVGAIVVVHWPNWFYFSNGFEYNFVLLGLCLMLVLGHTFKRARRERHNVIEV